jgi:hypothetical protein
MNGWWVNWLTKWNYFCYIHKPMILSNPCSIRKLILMDEDERYFSTVSPMKNKLCKKWTDHLDFVMCMFAWKIFTLETFCLQRRHSYLEGPRNNVLMILQLFYNLITELKL